MNSQLSRPLARAIAAITAVVIVAAGCVGRGGAAPSEGTRPAQTSTPASSPSAVPVSASELAPSPTASRADQPEAATPTPTIEPTADETRAGETVAYFLLVGPDGAGRLVPVRRVVEPGYSPVQAGLEALFGGPSPYEVEVARLSTSIPGTATIQAVDPVADEGRLSIDVSAELDRGDPISTRAGVAQIVYTATRVPGIRAVRVTVNGRRPDLDGLPDRALTRDDFVDLLPPIFVDTPAWGAVLIGDARSRLRLAGTANVFEGAFRVQLTNARGVVLDQARVAAACGTGCRGEFEAWLGADARGDVRLDVWTRRTVDGAKSDRLRYELTFLEADPGGGCGC